MDNPMKTREEYLIEFEIKLLEILKDLYKSVNYNFAITYGLSILVVFFHLGSVTDINFIGVNLALNKTDMLIFVPILVSIVFILINFQLIKIAEVYRHIYTNANELLSINQEAKPFTMKEIHLFSAGVTGLILSLANWQAKRLLTNNPFKFRPVLRSVPLRPLKEDSIFKWALYYLFSIAHPMNYLSEWILWIIDIILWLIRTAIRSLIAVFLFMLPIILVGYYNYNEFFYNQDITFRMPLVSLCIMVLVAISTIVSGFVLFATYLVDLVESFKMDFSESLDEIKITLKIFWDMVNFFIQYWQFPKNK